MKQRDINNRIQVTFNVLSLNALAKSVFGGKKHKPKRTP